MKTRKGTRRFSQSNKRLPPEADDGRRLALDINTQRIQEIEKLLRKAGVKPSTDGSAALADSIEQSKEAKNGSDKICPIGI